MMRSQPATADEKRANFDWCLAEALQGDLPPTETGLRGATIDALWAVADAVVDQQPTDELVAKARAALAAELNT